MNKMFGIGIVGAGDILYYHASSLGALRDKARFIGLADLNKISLGKASNRYFVPYTFTDYQNLLKRDDIDVIIVATPPATHEQIVIDALSAGKHVICEKPMAHTLESADRIIEAGNKYQGKLSFCYQFRFMPEIRRIIWLRDNGFLGNMIFGNFLRITLKGSTGNWWGQWNTAGGGVVITQFIHQLDMIIQIFGNPVSVFAEMDTLQQDIESEDTFGATIKFENGAIVGCGATLNAHRVAEKFDVIGERASVHLPWAVCSNDRRHMRKLIKAMNQEKSIAEFHKQGSISSIVKKIKNEFVGDGIPAKVMRTVLPKLGIQIQIGEPPLHKSLIAAFLDAVRNNFEVPVSAEEARKSLELCTAIYTSAITGEIVSLPLAKSTPFYKGINADVYRNRKTNRTSR
ncbi:MAG: Gfo/Idh/MocA family oxidoreductase [Candidatus Omnitrophica bacterium]|nr:Gfo/Idh/MocA family oxidoreductase [Candidatus Omnitrophota bacterium]